MEIYLKLFEVLFPVFFVVGIGYYLGKKDPNIDTSFITTYSGNFGTPALVIFALTAGGVTFQVFAEFFIYAIVLLTSFGLVGLVFLLLMKKAFKNIMTRLSVYGNLYLKISQYQLKKPM